MSRHEDFGNYLAERYQNIFSKPLWVECNEGWHPIIDDLSKEVSEIAKKFPAINGENRINVVQIKEKFGGLRYYVDYHSMSDDDIQQIEYVIRNAEMKTFIICEDCGGNGEKVSPKRYWMKTLCTDCQNKYDMGDTPNGI
jgi:hypothetical protein